MCRLTLPVLILLLLIMTGCAGHSTRHTNRERIQACGSFPCGSEVIFHDMVLNWEVQREPTGECVLTGTIMPRGIHEGTKVELAVMSIELARDLTIFDSFSFPIVTRDMRLPLKFEHRFKPSGGFDGLTFNWDLHIDR